MGAQNPHVDRQLLEGTLVCGLQRCICMHYDVTFRIYRGD